MNLTGRHRLAVAAMLLAGLGADCSFRDPADLDLAKARVDPLVFDDDYGEGVYFQPFMDTYTQAVSLDSVYAQSGTRSLKVTIPPEGSPLGAFAGGVLTSAASRDHTGFNALTFYARSGPANVTLNDVGFGNDNTGTSIYKAGLSNIEVSTAWRRVVIPIPAPDRLIAERGQFMFSEGYEDLLGGEMWFDDIRFTTESDISNPRPSMRSLSKLCFVGATVGLENTRTLFAVGDDDVMVNHDGGYFDLQFSKPGVAKAERGMIRVVGADTTFVTASLDGVQATGTLRVIGRVPPSEPAPAPTHPAADVISLFSRAYQDVPVDTWRADWSQGEYSEFEVGGRAIKMYSNLYYAGILFRTRTIDATAMTHLHLDVFAPEGTNFKVKVVALDGVNGNTTQQSELTFDAGSTPAFVAGQWSSLDIPLADFQLTDDWEHIGEIVISGNARLVLLDNLYWHK